MPEFAPGYRYDKANMSQGTVFIANHVTVAVGFELHASYARLSAR